VLYVIVGLFGIDVCLFWNALPSQNLGAAPATLDRTLVARRSLLWNITVGLFGIDVRLFWKEFPSESLGAAFDLALVLCRSLLRV